MSSLRSPIRRIGVALICLMTLTLTSCATLQPSISFGPPPDEGGPQGQDEEVSSLSDMGNVMTVVAVVVVGGYVVYKIVTRNRGEAEGRSEFRPSVSPSLCAPLVPLGPAFPRVIEPTPSCMLVTPSS
jgi:hypothetical protein